MTKDMCPRYAEVRHAVSSDIATELMYDEIDYDMERSGFYEKLRELTGESEASIHVVH